MRLYLDMDGVCVNFVEGFFRLLGWEVAEALSRWRPGDHYFESLGLSQEFIHQQIAQAGAAFWENLDPYPGTLEHIRRWLAGGALLLSAPTPDPGAVAGKIAWIHRHLPGYEDRYILTRHKEDLAQTDRLLVDDADHNVDSFRQSGGLTVQVPQRWNRLHALPHGLTDTTVQMVETLLLQLSAK